MLDIHVNMPLSEVRLPLASGVEELAGGGVGAWCEDSAGRVIAGSFASHDVRVGREPFEAVSALCGDDWFGLLVEDG